MKVREITESYNRKRMSLGESLRRVKVTFDNGHVMTTDVPGNRTDDQIKDYYTIGKEFNIGDGERDKIAKVDTVEILDEAAWGDDWDEDWDAEPEEKPEDPDKDKVPHILMQLKKAADAGGNFPIKFKDGSEHKLDLDDIVAFVEMYMEVKPDAKELMQTKGAQSKEAFQKVIKSFTGKKALPSIYEKTHGNSKIYDRCWPGHRRVPGTTRGEPGSCEKI